MANQIKNYLYFILAVYSSAVNADIGMNNVWMSNDFSSGSGSIWSIISAFIIISICCAYPGRSLIFVLCLIIGATFGNWFGEWVGVITGLLTLYWFYSLVRKPNPKNNKVNNEKLELSADPVDENIDSEHIENEQAEVNSNEPEYQNTRKRISSCDGDKLIQRDMKMFKENASQPNQKKHDQPSDYVKTEPDHNINNDDSFLKTRIKSKT